MPTRYNSFIISSYVQSKRLAFPYRFFRYFHKQFIRKNYWSSSLLMLWKTLDYNNNSLGMVLTKFLPLQSKRLSLFFDLKLLIILFLLGAKVFIGLAFSTLARLFWYCLFCQEGLLTLLWVSILLNFNKVFFKNTLSNYSSSQFSTVAYVEPSHCHLSIYNRLFSGAQAKNIRKYLVLEVGHRLNVFCHHGYYRPWVKRFVFSLKRLNFLKVFPKFNVRTKRNAIGHPRLRKDIGRYN